jgi:hypothetical protein
MVTRNITSTSGKKTTHTGIRIFEVSTPVMVQIIDAISVNRAIKIMIIVYSLKRF